MVQLTLGNFNTIKNMDERFLEYCNVYNPKGKQNSLNTLKNNPNNIIAHGFAKNIEHETHHELHHIENFHKVYRKCYEASISLDSFKEHIPFLQIVFPDHYELKTIQMMFQNKVPSFICGEIEREIHKKFYRAVWGEERENQEIEENANCLPEALVSGLFKYEHFEKQVCSRTMGVIFAYGADFETQKSSGYRNFHKYLTDKICNQENQDENLLLKYIEKITDNIIYSSILLAHQEQHQEITILFSSLGLGNFASAISANDIFYQRLSDYYFYGYLKAFKKYAQIFPNISFNAYFFNYENSDAINRSFQKHFAKKEDYKNIKYREMKGYHVNIFDQNNINSEHINDSITFVLVHASDAHAFIGNSLQSDFSMESMLLGRLNKSYLTAFPASNLVMSNFFSLEKRQIKEEYNIEEEEGEEEEEEEEIILSGNTNEEIWEKLSQKFPAHININKQEKMATMFRKFLR
jgi:hypothetical protein